MRRRSLLLGLAAGIPATGGALLWAPGAFARNPHNSYFSLLNESLKREGPGRPVMLIDRDAVNHNVDMIADSVGHKKKYRVVVKSLPSLALLGHVMSRSKTNSLMVFHQPFLNAVAENLPQSDVLLGKPLPVSAARTFYSKLGNRSYDAANKIQWLIDSPDRLLQYMQLAKDLGVSLKLNIEIDVGLRRGGYSSIEQFNSSLEKTRASGSLVQISGLMGYEPHLTGRKAQLQDKSVQDVLAVYRGFKESLANSGLDYRGMTFNGAGSHTLKIYEKDDTMNDLSAGSAVVMPTDFDTYHLQENRPACFIATPILKRYEGNPFLQAPSKNMERLYYIYGGYWKANIASPPTIGKPIYQSTNQSPITTAADVELDVDDYVFYRPTQSEHVMLQFGDLITVSGGKLEKRWPVFTQTG